MKHEPINVKMRNSSKQKLHHVLYKPFEVANCIPAVGGMPYSSAMRKSSSTSAASRSPAAFLAAWSCEVAGIACQRLRETHRKYLFVRALNIPTVKSKFGCVCFGYVHAVPSGAVTQVPQIAGAGLRGQSTQRRRLRVLCRR
jgi:hypothetical protein